MDNAADLPKPIDEAIAHDGPKLDRASYEAEKAKLQVELLKVQLWA
jgi:hypothetical protein